MIVIAHRGSSQLAPENTLPAIEQALKDGIEAIEIDVQLTQDERVVVIHDEWLDRTTTGSGFIFLKPYSVIRRFDAGTWFHPRFKGTRVPLLEEVLERLKGSSTLLNIELKNNLIAYPGLEQKVIQLVEFYGMSDNVIISSFRTDSLETCLYLAPSIRRGLLYWGDPSAIITTPIWRELQLYSIHPSISLLTEELSELQQHGIRIYPYVIERKSQLERCLRYNVDGLFTSCPRRIRHLLMNV